MEYLLLLSLEQLVEMDHNKTHLKENQCGIEVKYIFMKTKNQIYMTFVLYIETMNLKAKYLRNVSERYESNC